MNPLMLLKGDTLGKTIYNTLAFIAAVIVVLFLGFRIVTGNWYEWKYERAAKRADTAESNLKVSQENTRQATAATAIGAETTARMASGTLDIRLHTEQSAGSVENYESDMANDDGSLPPDIMRALTAAHDKAGAAANRLRREDAR